MGFVAGDMAAKAFPTFWIMTVRFLGAAVWMGLLFRRAVKSSTKEDIKAGMILGGLLFLAQPLQIILWTLAQHKPRNKRHNYHIRCHQKCLL